MIVNCHQHFENLKEHATILDVDCKTKEECHFENKRSQEEKRSRMGRKTRRTMKIPLPVQSPKKGKSSRTMFHVNSASKQAVKQGKSCTSSNRATMEMPVLLLTQTLKMRLRISNRVEATTNKTMGICMMCWPVMLTATMLAVAQQQQHRQRVSL